MTGRNILDNALDICGLKNTSGADIMDTSDLRERALALLNIVLGENSILDSRIRKTEHKVISISSLSDEIDCSDIVAATVLPYGLAKMFMVGEDDALAADLERLYNDAKKNALTFGNAKFEEITEVYG